MNDMEVIARRHLSAAALALLWVAALGVGGWQLVSYSEAAGAPGSAPLAWPAESHVIRAAGWPTLVMLVHPQCPCTRASVGELAELMAHAQGRVAVHVLFAKPDGAPAGWTSGALWDAVSAIPNVTVHADEHGTEARLFGAETSGQTLLFDTTGRLIFRGGITAARGHAGPNAGSTALAALLEGARPQLDQTLVYGCALF